MQWLQRLLHRRRLQHPRAADEAAPDVWHLDPVGIPLRLNSDAAPDHRTERDDCRDRDVIRLTLQAICDVSDPRLQRNRREIEIERLDRCQSAGPMWRINLSMRNVHDLVSWRPECNRR